MSEVVTIAEDAVVAGGSDVPKGVPVNAIFRALPAKLIKMRTYSPENKSFETFMFCG